MAPEEYSFNHELGSEGSDKVVVRFVSNSEGTGFVRFAIAYLTTIEGKPVEVIRYDCDDGERMHVHRFYMKGASKTYLDEPKTFETLLRFLEDIERHWRAYKMKLLEGKYFI